MNVSSFARENAEAGPASMFRLSALLLFPTRRALHPGNQLFGNIVPIGRGANVQMRASGPKSAKAPIVARERQTGSLGLDVQRVAKPRAAQSRQQMARRIRLQHVL